MKETLKTPETKVQCVVSENIHTPPEERIGNSWGGRGGGGPKGPKSEVNVLSLTGISREVGGGGGLMKNPFRGGGMDNFWNHTMRT